MKIKQKHVMTLATDTVKAGVLLGAGHTILGGLKTVPEMPPQGTQTLNTVGTGLNLVGVGVLANAGMGLVNTLGIQTKSSKKKTTGDDRIDRMLGF